MFSRSGIEGWINANAVLLPWNHYTCIVFVYDLDFSGSVDKLADFLTYDGIIDFILYGLNVLFEGFHFFVK